MSHLTEALPEEPRPSPADPVVTAAREHFGVEYLYPYQRLVIANILDTVAASRAREETHESPDGPGDQLVVLPTGSGKSLCFSLPAAMLPGVTVVVYPLLGLVADQERRLRSVGLSPIVLRGGLSRSDRENLLRLLERGERRIVLTNPETLSSEPLCRRLADTGVDHFVIDEAHCVGEWGETFRPSYLELGRIKVTLSPRVTTAFTATASPPIVAAIVNHLFGKEHPHLVCGNPDRPNISYHVLPTLSKEASLAGLLGGAPDANAPWVQWRPGLPVRRPAIVFCRSRTTASLTAMELRRRLVSDEVFFYHAGLSREEKNAMEEWFFESKSGILCATCAYGMGVDKSDVRTVIHLDPAPSVEAYLQESGRAGRDGSAADAILLSSPSDRSRVQAGGSVADRATAVVDYAQAPGCRRRHLLSLLGAENEYCAGCDSCAGTRSIVPEGWQELRRVLRRHPRSLSQREAAEHLAGRIAGWEAQDIEAALAMSRSLDLVRPAAGLLWKNRLRLTRKGRLHATVDPA